MNNKKWLITFGIILAIVLISLTALVAVTDPFFHYHKPLPCFHYILDNERSQNDGITKRFDYQGIITGTSMTENFKASEAEEIFGCKFIKVSYSGGRFKELNDNIRNGLRTHDEIKYVIRSLDQDGINKDKDYSRTDLGTYPEYLYDDNIFNDVKYILNKDVIFSRSVSMVYAWLRGMPSGMTSFDDYARWDHEYDFGANEFLKYRSPFSPPAEEYSLTEEDRIRISENIRQNVTSLVEEYPDTQFYYFFPPYSAVFWGDLWENGCLKQHIEIQRAAIEEMLRYPNLKVFSFDTCTDLTTDMARYKDAVHYDPATNSWILQQMHNGEGLLTEDNYEEYLNNLLNFYTEFDFNSLFEQVEP